MIDELSEEEKRRQYYKRYYKKNKERIKRQRNERYNKNEKYRQYAKTAAKAYYRTKHPKKISANYSTKKIDGQVVYGMKYASSVIRRSPELIRRWEAQGWIPPTQYTDKRNWRFYTETQMKLLEYAFASLRAKEITKAEFVSLVHTEWENKNWRESDHEQIASEAGLD